MEKFLPIFEALSDGTRLKILDLLLTSDLCVGAIAARLGVTNACISQHMQVLRKAGLVKGEKRGYWTHYFVDKMVLEDISDALNNLCKKNIKPENVCLRHLNQKERRCEDMCETCCMHPEKLKGKPKECSPEQIKECHGDQEVHPCEIKEEKK